MRIVDNFGWRFQVKPDTIVQIWSGDAIDIDRVTSAGFRALFSSCWYLDYTSYGQDWDKYYRCEQIGESCRAWQALLTLEHVGGVNRDLVSLNFITICILQSP